VNTAEILARTADVIDEVGWYQGDLYDPRGTGMCTLAAIYAAAGVDMAKATPSEADAICAAIESLQGRLGVESVVNWNDAPERTAEQVTSALRRCAAEVAERDGIRRPEQLAIAGASS